MINETKMDYEAYYEKTKRVSIPSTIIFINIGLILIIMGILLLNKSIWFLLVFGVVGVFLFVTFFMYGLKGYKKELIKKATQFGETVIVYTFNEEDITLQLKVDNVLKDENVTIYYTNIKSVIEYNNWIIFKTIGKYEMIINKSTMIKGSTNDLVLLLKQKCIKYSVKK